MKEFARNNKKWILIAAVVLGVAGVAAVAAMWPHREAILEWVNGARGQFLNWLQSIPPLLYLAAFAVLPVFGAPLTLFYITAIPVLGGPYGIYGILGGWLAIFINAWLGYWLSTGVLHSLVERLLRWRAPDARVPKISPDNAVRWIVLTRVSPLPFWAQHYLLGLGHAPLRPYLLISFLIQAPIGLAVMLVGDSLFRGGFKYAMLGLFLFILLGVAAQIVRRRLTRKPELEDPVDPQSSES